METKRTAETTNIAKVETKQCSVKLVRLDTILFGDFAIKKKPKPSGCPKPHSRNTTSTSTRLPRNASKDKQYTEDPEPSSPIRVHTTHTKNTRPSASGPSEERVKAQLQQSEQLTVSLPALPAREEDP